MKNARQHSCGSSAQTERIHFRGNDLQKAKVDGRLGLGGPGTSSRWGKTPQLLLPHMQRHREGAVRWNPGVRGSADNPNSFLWASVSRTVRGKTELSALKTLPALKCESRMESESESFTSHSQGPLPPLTTCIILSKLLGLMEPHL